MAQFLEFPTNASNAIADPVANFAALPVAGTVVGQLIVTQDTGTIYEWNGTTWQVAGGGGGSGDVVGPASSVNSQVALFNGTTGKLLKASTATGVAKLSSGVLSTSLVDLSAEVTGVLPVANGGTNSNAALSGNKAIASNGTAIVESSTTATELGYVSGVTSAIQTQFAGKASTSRALNTTAPITGGGDLSADRTIAIAKSTGSVDGYLAAADFTIFSAKVGPTRTISTTAPITGGGDLSADRTFAIAKATGSVDGYLAAADFATFAAKQASGNYITALTGDVTAAGPGSAAATIAAGAVDNSKVAAGAAIAVSKLAALTANKAVVSDGSGILSSSVVTSTEVGYLSGVTSALQTQINGRALSARAINTSAPLTGGGDLSADRTLAIAQSSGTVDGYLAAADFATFAAKQAAGNYITALTGDIAASGPGSAAATIQAGAVTNSKIAALAAISLNKLAALTVSSPVRSDASGFLTTGQTNLASEVTGVLPIANGGTNSSTALNNNRVVVSSGSAIVEAAAITVNRALASSASGLPVASATTDTELGFVSGVTSAIQTQLNGKQASGNYITALTGDVTASGPGSAASTIAAGAVTNTKIAAAAGISVNKLAAQTASVAAVYDASGFLTASATTATELGFVSGVTSSIQTQLNAILAISSIVAVSTNVTLTNKAVHLVTTTSARSLTLPAPSTTSLIIIKDATGSANLNNITVVRFGSEKIETVAASFVLDSSLGSWTFVSNGTDWFVI